MTISSQELVQSQTISRTSEQSRESTIADIRMEGIIQEFKHVEGGVTRVIDNVDLHLNTTEINMLLGPSGCGKSTLLHMMGGIRPFDTPTPTQGKVFIDGQLCLGGHDDVVMVFQRYSNRPDLTVYENIILPFRFKLWRNRIVKSEWERRAKDMIEAVGLADKQHLYPSQLSGGQNQRVALARALALQPRILLMDEPFGALDAQTRDEMQTLLIKLNSASKCLIVFVTHDVREALVLGDRILMLSKPPAKIIKDIRVNEPKPRSAAWLNSTESLQLQAEIMQQLHRAVNIQNVPTV